MIIAEFLVFLLRAFYLFTLAALALYGLLGLFTLGVFWKHRRRVSFRPLPTPAEPAFWPIVTVQLPLFNERFVVERLVHSVATLDYPPECLEIQVVDDSTDETTVLAEALVHEYRRRGVNIHLLHRLDRRGFKAGALAEALASAHGEYIAVFDADFRPPSDFLRQTIPPFLQNPRLGIVQARWGHLNGNASPLTAAQAIALDKHFAIEQTVRSQAGFFPKFNGTAGVLRRACIEDAGGWEMDTVCEDLCLSTRALLRNWQLEFLPHVVAPAELPESIVAYKSQQSRWAKGSMQCLLKFGRAILRSQHTLLARAYALLSMSAYMASLLLLVLLLLQVPLILLDIHLPAGWTVLGLAGLGQPLLLVTAQQMLYSGWQRRLLYLPVLLLVAIGISVTIARAVVQGAYRRDGHPFVRTPKAGEGGYRSGAYQLPFDWIVLVEVLLVVYAAAGILLALETDNSEPLFLLVASMLSYGYVAALSLRDWLGNRVHSKQQPARQI